jgi:hypothetical protein
VISWTPPRAADIYVYQALCTDEEDGKIASVMHGFKP